MAARRQSNGPREAAQHGKPTKPDDNRRLSAASALPGKTTLLGKSDTLPGKSHFSERDDLPGKIRQRQSIGLPDKIRQEATERRGWIEYAKRGTKNPKRYAYRRRWKKIGGKWIKAESKRLKSIPPLTEEEYVRRITGEGRNPTTGRKRRDRAD